MPFSIIRDDITRLPTDAIVNAANTDLRMGGGVCGSIFRAAGAAALQQACQAIGHCDTGKAVVTPGFDLLARYIIHTPGPIWRGGTQNEESLLRDCYLNSLRLAASLGLHSVAFPLISGGIYGYPREACIQTAVSAIRGWLMEEDDSDMDVFLVLFGREPLLAGSKLYRDVTAILHPQVSMSCMVRPDEAVPARAPAAKKGSPLASFFRKHREKQDAEPLRHTEAFPAASAPNPDAVPLTDSFMEAEMTDGALIEPDTVCSAPELSSTGRHEPIRCILTDHETFRERLLSLIDSSGRTDADVYKAANMDRRLFSKIRSSDDYIPSKPNVIALCLSLRLSLRDARELLALAGYTLSPAIPRDQVIRYCLQNEQYNIFLVNTLLFDLDLPTLTA